MITRPSLASVKRSSALWLSQGVSPRRLALTLALGLAIGCIPVFGISTLVCAALAAYAVYAPIGPPEGTSAQQAISCSFSPLSASAAGYSPRARHRQRAPLPCPTLPRSPSFMLSALSPLRQCSLGSFSPCPQSSCSPPRSPRCCAAFPLSPPSKPATSALHRSFQSDTSKTVQNCNRSAPAHFPAYGSGTACALSTHAVRIMSRSMLAPAASRSAVNARDSALPAPANPPAFSS